MSQCWVRIPIRRIRKILGLPVQDPDPLVRGTDPGIRIRNRTKMSWIPNTAVSYYKPYPRKKSFYIFFILKNKLALLKFKINHFDITLAYIASKLSHKLMRVLSKQVCTSYFNSMYILPLRSGTQEMQAGVLNLPLHYWCSGGRGRGRCSDRQISIEWRTDRHTDRQTYIETDNC